MERVKIFQRNVSGSTDELGKNIFSFLRKPALSEVQSTLSRSASKTGMIHDSCNERCMVTISEARRSNSKMTTMETKIAAEIQFANLKYQHEKKIIELKLRLNTEQGKI
jgi:dynactin complex subunit